jgi:hypothetical protein
MSKDIENKESADSKIENEADHEYNKRANRCSEKGQEEMHQEKNPCENSEISDDLKEVNRQRLINPAKFIEFSLFSLIQGDDKDLEMKTHLHLQKALNQLIALVNSRPLGNSQRKQILKILPVFIEQNIKVRIGSARKFDKNPEISTFF